MASILDLPEEILISIIRRLDIKSVYNLYKTCQSMKTIVVMQGVLRVCKLSLSTLSTSKSLQLGMIKDVANHLFELNMSAVRDLRKSSLLPAIKRMKCLRTLDVSYTNITILDLLDLYKHCPTIKNISINFEFGTSHVETLPDKTLQQYQELFTNFTNVHFVLTFLLTNFPLKVLSKSSLNTLKYTVCDWSLNKYTVCDWRLNIFQDQYEPMVPFNHFCIYMLDSTNTSMAQGMFQIMFPTLNLDSTEYIIIEYILTNCVVWSSPLFVQFFSDNFKITPQLLISYKDKIMCGNFALFIWNKETTNFDETFYFILKRKIKEIFTCEIEISNKKPLALATDIKGYDWVSLKLTEPIGSGNNVMEMAQSTKKRRIAATGLVLDYDKLFSEHKYINLLMYFSSSGVVNLSTNNNYLKKITYLSLAGPLVRYNNDFFNILFRTCDNLITLNIEASSLCPCSSAIVRSISLSQSLKNIRLVDKRIDFKMLFSSFSQCKTLENICIYDISTEFNALGDPTSLYQMCTKLYNIYIHAPMRGSIEKYINSIMKSLLKKHGHEHHVNFRFVNTYNVYYNHITSHQGSYDPYLGSFGVKLIKQI